MDQRRAHFRIEYPIGMQPKVKINKKEYDVIDISEGGFCFDIAKPQDFELGQNIEAQVSFYSGEQLTVSGVVVRHGDQCISCQLDPMIPQKVIMSEHRTIIRLCRDKLG